MISERSKTIYCKQLDEAYNAAVDALTKFLLTQKAKSIFQSAAEELKNYKLKFPEENAEILRHAQKAVELVVPGIPTINIKAK